MQLYYILINICRCNYMLNFTFHWSQHSMRCILNWSSMEISYIGIVILQEDHTGRWLQMQIVCRSICLDLWLGINMNLWDFSPILNLGGSLYHKYILDVINPAKPQPRLYNVMKYVVLKNIYSQHNVFH